MGDPVGAPECWRGGGLGRLDSGPRVAARQFLIGQHLGLNPLGVLCVTKDRPIPTPCCCAARGTSGMGTATGGTSTPPGWRWSEDELVTLTQGFRSDLPHPVRKVSQPEAAEADGDERAYAPRRLSGGRQQPFPPRGVRCPFS
jgi:hypothetical protein